MSVKSSRFVLRLFALAVVLFGMFGATLAPSASALGVQVFRTDSQGHKTGTVANIGNTGPGAFCAGYGSGTLGYGVAVCYL